MRLTPRQRNANSALIMAVTRTKKELKGKEQVKTIVTYPKGLYKKTLAKNLDKTMDEVGLPNKNSRTGSTTAKKKPTAKKAAAKKPAVKKVAAKKTAVKKAVTKKPVAKKAAAKKTVAPKMATKRKTTAKKKTTSPRKRKIGFVASIKKIFS